MMSFIGRRFRARVPRGSGLPRFLTPAIVAVAVLALLAGSVYVRNLIFSTLDGSLSVRSSEGRLRLALRLRLDDETDLRNFTATGDASYLGTLAQTMVKADAAADRLSAGLTGDGFPRASVAALAFAADNARWDALVAPVVHRPSRAAARHVLRPAVRLAGRIRADGAAVETGSAPMRSSPRRGRGAR